MDTTQLAAKKKFYKTWWFWAFLIFVVFPVIAANTSTPKKVGTSDSSVNQTPEVFKVGDRVQRGDTILTVTKVNKAWKSSNQFDTPSNTNEVYVVVTVTIENIGNSDIDLFSLWDFELEDGNGVQRGPSIGGIGLNKLPTGSLAPNGKVSGEMLFEAGKDATGSLKLRYKPLTSFGREAVIEL